VYIVLCSGGERLSFPGVPAPCLLGVYRNGDWRRQVDGGEIVARRQPVGDGAALLADDGSRPVTTRHCRLRHRDDGQSLLRRPVPGAIQQRQREPALLPDGTRLPEIVRRTIFSEQVQSGAQRRTVSVLS